MPRGDNRSDSLGKVERIERRTKSIGQARAKTRRASAKRVRKGRLPAFRSLQLATLVNAAPEGDAWLHEIKFDGYRILLAVGDRRARAFTRSGLDWSDKFSALLNAASDIKASSALMDGEAVVLDAEGRSKFQLMQGAFKDATVRPVFYAFDLLELNDEDLTRLPLIERKKRLQKLLGLSQTGIIRFSAHNVGDGAKLFRSACAHNLEGIVSKRASAPYVGARNEAWLKVKCLQRQEFVIVGWTASDKNRGFRSLMLATNERTGLRYVGKVGAGFDMAEIDALLKRMTSLARVQPTVEAPRAAVKGANWIEPKLAAEIAYTEMTTDGILRHPSYIGLREDKAASTVVMERAKTAPTAARGKRKGG